MIPFHDLTHIILHQWLCGKITQVTAVIQLESLFHETGILPEDEEINPDISEHDLTVLFEHALALTSESLDQVREHQAQRKALEQNVDTEVCPICKQETKQLFEEINLSHDLGMQVTEEQIKLSPPRCNKCVKKYLEGYLTKEQPPQITPMSLGELKFFNQYESEMQKFRK